MEQHDTRKLGHVLKGRARELLTGVVPWGSQWVLQQLQPQGTLTELCLHLPQSTHLGRDMSDSPSPHGSTEELIWHTRHHSLGHAYTKVLDAISGVTFFPSGGNLIIWTNSALPSSPIQLSPSFPRSLGYL